MSELLPSSSSSSVSSSGAPDYKNIIDYLDVDLDRTGFVKLFYYLGNDESYEILREGSYAPPSSRLIPIAILKEVLLMYKPNNYRCDTKNGLFSFSRIPSKPINILLADDTRITSDYSLNTEIARYITYRAQEMLQLRNEGKSTGRISSYSRIPKEFALLRNSNTQNDQENPLSPSSTVSSVSSLSSQENKSYDSKTQPSQTSRYSQSIGAPMTTYMSYIPLGNIGNFGSSGSMGNGSSLLSSLFSSMLDPYYSQDPSGQILNASLHYPQPERALTLSDEEYYNLERRELTSKEKEYIQEYKNIEQKALSLPRLEGRDYEIKEKAIVDEKYRPHMETLCNTCGICQDYLSDMINVTKCKHIFHCSCLKKHLTQYSYKCPFCQIPVVDIDTSSSNSHHP